MTHSIALVAGNRLEPLLRFELGARVDIVGLGRIALPERPCTARRAVHMRRADEDEALHPAPRGGLREPCRPLDIDPPCALFGTGTLWQMGKPRKMDDGLAARERCIRLRVAGKIAVEDPFMGRVARLRRAARTEAYPSARLGQRRGRRISQIPAGAGDEDGSVPLCAAHLIQPAPRRDRRVSTAMRIVASVTPGGQ